MSQTSHGPELESFSLTTRWKKPRSHHSSNLAPGKKGAWTGPKASPFSRCEPRKWQAMVNSSLHGNQYSCRVLSHWLFRVVLWSKWNKSTTMVATLWGGNNSWLNMIGRPTISLSHGYSHFILESLQCRSCSNTWANRFGDSENKRSSKSNGWGPWWPAEASPIYSIRDVSHDFCWVVFQSKIALHQPQAATLHLSLGGDTVFRLLTPPWTEFAAGGTEKAHCDSGHVANDDFSFIVGGDGRLLRKTQWSQKGLEIQIERALLILHGLP